MAKKIAIVIVTHNSEQQITGCVEGLLSCCDMPREDVELIVVDNNSSDVGMLEDTLRALWQGPLTLIKNVSNAGYGAGNNGGIRAATAPLVLVMNPDVRLCCPLFRAAEALFAADETLALLGMEQWESAKRRSFRSFYALWYPLNGYLRYLLTIVGNRLRVFLPRYMAIQGACFFVRRDMFLAVGGYDDEHFLYGEEEVLHRRLTARYGADSVRFTRRLRYIHPTSQRAPSLAHEQQLYEANVALYAKEGVAEAVLRRHFLQTNTLLLIKERLRGRESERYTTLRAFRDYLQSRGTKRKGIAYIDPQSYHNLAVYDYCLLANMCADDISYYHNCRYDAAQKPPCRNVAAFSYSGKKGVAKAVSYAKSIAHIARDIRRQQVAVVHIQWLRLLPVDFLFLAWCHQQGAKVLFTAHNLYPHTAGAILRKSYNWYYRHVDSIIVHDKTTQEKLAVSAKIPLQKVQVIHHGLLPAAAGTPLKRRQTTQDDKIVVAALGYQSYYKGIDILADVWRNYGLKDEGKIQLIIAGKGSEELLAPFQGIDNVQIINRVLPPEEFEQVLNNIDVALLPYREISMSGVLATCLDRQIPVVVSNVGGLSEPLSYGKVGWNIGAPTADNLYAALQHILQHPQEIDDVRQNTAAYTAVRRAYNWQTIALTTRSLYSSLL